MYACQRCQEQLLDHLYDLLPEPEQAQLLAHLDSCSACRQALATAHAQQRLLAAAAKRTFAEVRFQPPQPTSVPPTARAPEPVAATVLPRAASQASVSRWYRRAALAAGVLLCLGGGQVWYLHNQQQAQSQQLAQLLAVTREQLHEEQHKKQAQLEALQEEFRQELKQLETQADSQHLRVVVTGPRHLAPGTPTECTVQILDRQGKPLDALLHVEVDRAGLEVTPLPNRKEREQHETRGQPTTQMLSSRSGTDRGHADDGVAPAKPDRSTTETLLKGQMPPSDTSPRGAGGPRPSAVPVPGLGDFGGSKYPINPPTALGHLGGLARPSASPERFPPRSAVPLRPGNSTSPPFAGPSPRDDFAKSDQAEKPPQAVPPAAAAAQQGSKNNDNLVEPNRRLHVRRERLALQRVALGTYKLTLPPDVLPEGGEVAMKVRARAAEATSADREPPSLEGQITLGAPIYRTYLATDRLVYQPGDVVRFRSLTLDQADRLPPEDELPLRFALVAPNGQEQLSDTLPMRLVDAENRPMIGPDG
ncbi:MAG: zf-HC2 domain-containing protein, partial [Gemmataceae bacterium]